VLKKKDQEFGIQKNYLSKSKSKTKTFPKTYLMEEFINSRDIMEEMMK
jgi:glutaredoxin-related protein